MTQAKPNLGEGRQRFLTAAFGAAVALWSVGAEAQVYSEAVLFYEPVSYWRLGEASGPTAFDLVGGNHGTYENNVTLGIPGALSGDEDTAVHFAGGNQDRVQVPGFGLSGSGITMLAWFNANSFGDRRFLTKATGTGSGDNHWSFGTRSSSKLRVMLRINNSGVSYDVDVGNMEAGVWYFAAVTFDGTTIRTYLNGVHVHSRVQPGSLSTDSAVAIGLGNQPTGGGNRPFNGVLDEIAVFDKPLTANQIANLYWVGGGTLVGGGMLGQWMLNETSGTVAVDSGPYAHDGTYTNAPTLGIAGPYPGAGSIGARFNGVDQYVSIPHHDRYKVADAISVAAWIKVNEFTKTDQTIVAKGHESWRLMRNGNTNTLRFACEKDSNDPIVNGTIEVDDGRWHHVVATHDRNTIRLYIDGVLDASASTTRAIKTVNDPINIARNSGILSTEWHGSIHDVRVYGRALSASEVTQLYGLVGRWKLTESGGTTATDSSLMANDGTYLNGVSLNASGPYPGAGSKAAGFDGINDYVSIPKHNAYQSMESLAVAAWVKVDAFDKNFQTIVAKGDSAWRLSRAGTQDVLYFGCTGLSTEQVEGVSDINDGRWHHVIAVYDGSQLSLYVDGVLDASVAASGTIALNEFDVWIGANAETAGREWNGWLHDVRLYNRALSNIEIANLYGLVGHWKLDEISGSAAVDTAGGNDGVYQNNVTLGVPGVPLYGGNTAAQFGGGSNDRVQVPAFDMSGSGISILAWFKANSFSDARFVSKATSTAVANHYWMFGTAGTSWLSVVLRNSSGSAQYWEPSVGPMSTGVWYFAALTFDGSTVRVYLNGTQVFSTAWSATLTTNSSVPIGLGNQPSGAGARGFNGVLDDVRVYNRALWPEDIQALFDAGSGLGGVRIIRWVEIQ